MLDSTREVDSIVSRCLCDENRNVCLRECRVSRGFWRELEGGWVSFRISNHSAIRIAILSYPCCRCLTHFVGGGGGASEECGVCGCRTFGKFFGIGAQKPLFIFFSRLND